MITCILRMRFDVGPREEAIQVLRTLVGPVRSQPGCTHTLLMLDVQDDAVITWVSGWKDRSSLDRHLLSTHFRRILAVMELAAERPGIAFECGSEIRSIDLIHEVIGGADHPPDPQSSDLGPVPGDREAR
jgi:quinol monooxygenase YgiN